MTEQTYAFAYSMHGPWKGSFPSRAQAEEAGREVSDIRDGRFTMVWTARIISLSVGDLVRGGPLIRLLRDQTDYLFPDGSVPQEQLDTLEDTVGILIDQWAKEVGWAVTIPRYVERQPGFHVIDYDTVRAAHKGGDMAHKEDTPVHSETHYETIVGRIRRFHRRRKRVDLGGVPLDDRIKVMERALLEWDAKFPIPGIHRYEARVREIKAVLRSPWPPLGVSRSVDEEGNYVYPDIAPDLQANRDHYRRLQKELRWLKRRLTTIYAARQWRRSPEGKAWFSETRPSTAVG